MKKTILILIACVTATLILAAPPAGKKKLKAETPRSPHTLAAITNNTDLADLRADVWQFATTSLAAPNLVAVNAVEPRSNNIVRVRLDLEITKAQFAILRETVAQSVEGVTTNTATVDMQFRYQRMFRRYPDPVNTNQVLVETIVKPAGFVHLRERD